MTAGLDHWYEREDGETDSRDIDVEEYKFDEWRLQQLLGVSHFRLPPDYRSRRRAGETTPNCLINMAEKTINEVDIWTGVIAPNRADIPEPSANAILGWSFNDDAKVRMEELANRNSRGELTESEREELEAYVNVGQVIGILQAKARISLNRSSGNGTE